MAQFPTLLQSQCQPQGRARKSSGVSAGLLQHKALESVCDCLGARHHDAKEELTRRLLDVVM